LIHAENARGKTTLAAVLRSLGTGDAIPVMERRRLAAQNPPHIVLDAAGHPQPAVFQNGAWDRTLGDVLVFDDAFVAENVCSGIAVDALHRQNLHELILGVQGVNLSRNLQGLVERIEVHNRALRLQGGAIPAAEMRGMNVDDFSELPNQPDMDTAIAAVERNLAAAREQEPIRQQPLFDALELPGIDLDGIEALLDRHLAALEAAAAERVQAHLAGIGRGGEGWIAQGVPRIWPPPHVPSAHSLPRPRR
jgi:wobble nucleotide-excising tRNase